MAETSPIVRTESVLVLGSGRQTVTVVRSLARAGHAVIVCRNGRRDSVEFSRHVSGVWIQPPRLQESAQLADALLDLLEARPDIRFVYPMSEFEIQAIRQRRREIAARAVLVLPADGALESCLDKRLTYALAEEVGVPFPRTRVVDCMADIERGARELGFPVVVKRPDSILVGGRKAVICRAPADLDAWREVIESERVPLVLQRWVAGDRHNCHIAARDGELVAYFQQKVLRTDEPDGTGLGVLGVSVAPTPVLRDWCAAMVRRASYTGVGCIQFLVEESTGSAALLEWNPRLDATCDLPYRCGVDFPLLGLRLAARSTTLAEPSRAPEGPPPVNPRNDRYPVGQRVYWPAGDLKGLLRQRRDGSLDRGEAAWRVAKLLASPLGRAQHLGWSWSDPLPTLLLVWRAVSSLARRVKPQPPAAQLPRRVLATTTVLESRRSTTRVSERSAFVRQLASITVPLAWSYSAVLAALLAILAVRVVWEIPTEHLLRDMANLTGAPPYFGAFSSVGILLWTAAATLCLFAVACVPVRAGARAFWLYGGLLSLALAADDLFLFHEILFPVHLGIPEPVVYVLYGALAAGFLVVCRRVILSTDYLLLVVALGWFALSLVVDRTGHLFLPRGFWLVEDGLKMLGIVSWLAYFARTAHRDLRSRV